jgi:putative ABC transport system permease protein
VAGLGAGLGMLVGLALSVLLINVINKQSFGWTIQFTLPLETLGVAVLVALLAAFLEAWGPARWVSRQSIAEDLRYGLNSVGASKSMQLFEFSTFNLLRKC